MKPVISLTLCWIFISRLGLGNPEPAIDISFTLVKLTKMNNKRAIRVSVRNDTDKNYFILATCLVNKVDSVHPCYNVDFMGSFSRIGSHIGRDCDYNPGEPLFIHLQTIPFVRKNHISLQKRMATNVTPQHLKSLFGYLTRSSDELKYPKFIFIEAKKSTFLYFNVNEKLDIVDKGNYRFDWFSKERLQETISPKNKRWNFKSAIKGGMINGYRFYEGDFVVHPEVIRL